MNKWSICWNFGVGLVVLGWLDYVESRDILEIFEDLLVEMYIMLVV